MHALLFSALLISQSPTSGIQLATDPEVSVERRAAPVTKILAEIGKEQNLQLVANDSFWHEVLVIRSEKTKLSELLNQIASTVNGRWTAFPGGYRLSPDAVLIKQSRDREIEAISRSLAKAQAKRKKEGGDRAEFTAESALVLAKKLRDVERKMQNPTGSQEVYKEYQRIQNQTPEGLLGTDLLDLIDVKAAASIDAGQRIVFSTIPTAMELQAGPKISELAARYMRDSAIYSKAREEADREENPSDEKGDGATDAPNNEHLQPEVGKVLIIISSTSDMGPGSLRLDLHVFSKEGKSLAHSRHSINAFEGDVEETQDLFKEKEGDVPVELSAEAKEMTGSMGDVLMGRTKPLPEATIQRYLKPEEIDPLNYVPSEIILAIARASGKNVVASISDMLFSLSQSQKLSVRQAQGFIGFVSHADPSADKKWILYKPKWPTFMRGLQCRRAALGKMLDAAYRIGRLDLETKATFIATSGSSAQNTVMNMGLQIAALLGFERFSYEPQTGLLKLYGVLSPLERQTLRQGKPLLVRSMSPEIQAVVKTMAYGPNSALRMVDQNSQAPQNQDREYESFAYAQYQSLSNILELGQESMPQGIPPDAYLTMSTKERTLIERYRTADSVQSASFGQSSVDNVAWDLFAKERPDLFPWITQTPPATFYRVGKSVDHFMTIHFTKQLVSKGVLSDVSIPTKAPAVAFEGLPSDIRDQIDKKIKDYRESYKDSKPGDFNGGQRTPPPKP